MRVCRINSPDYSRCILLVFRTTIFCTTISYISPKFVCYTSLQINRAEVKNARILANPGCYPTAAQLPLVPLLKAGLITPEDIIIDAKSGLFCHYLYVSLYVFISLFIYPFIYLFIYLSIYLLISFIYLHLTLTLTISIYVTLFFFFSVSLIVFFSCSFFAFLSVTLFSCLVC